MILGIGTDIVAVSRIRAVCERHGERFARRILHAGEWLGYCDAADPARLLARRFAAKEAVAKALGTGFRNGVGPSQIEVVHDARGAPGVRLYGAAADCVAGRGQTRLWLTISDERDYAVAYAVMEEAAP
ncbi:MAG TPA: holo-ACP synthase [Candidatus Macondimonas sp.]|nr:holo-ACP synthase [Candidatus Macondimonas sp.]